MIHFEVRYIDGDKASRIAKVHLPDGLDPAKRPRAIEAALKHSRHGYTSIKRVKKLTEGKK